MDWTKEAISDYCRKRDAAVIAAVRDNDIKPMKHLAEKADTHIPSDYVIMVSAHKMCLQIQTMDDELKSMSMKWLKEHGFKEGIY